MWTGLRNGRYYFINELVLNSRITLATDSSLNPQNAMCRVLHCVEAKFVVCSIVTVGLALYLAHPYKHVIQHTGSSLDCAIVGVGYFQLYDPIRDEYCYTRWGRLGRNEDGTLVIANTRFEVHPRMHLTSNSVKERILPNGDVESMQDGDETWLSVGQIELARFPRPQDLTPVSGDMFAATGNSGGPVLGPPGKAGLGYIQSGWLESSGRSFDRMDLITALVMLTSVCSMFVYCRVAKLLRLQELETKGRGESSTPRVKP